MSRLRQAAPAGVNPRWWAWEQDASHTGRNVDYMAWIMQKWREWEQRTGSDRRTLGEAAHHAFDEWLFLDVVQRALGGEP